MSEQVAVERHELDTLLAVARLYIDAFAEDEAMSLTEKLAFQDVEDVVAKYGPRPASSEEKTG
ncbi:hypothetical protein [Streptomyces sp. NPDC053367]|uniref:hypothetical protein n=1 Tax=Streptomyces sp. NPDC053367 TaxID=3365700 RepID=UPI0037D93E08